MNEDKSTKSSHQLWAQFRFGVVGGLLSAPAESGELAQRLKELSQIEWRHPVTGEKITFGISTIEHWYYEAKNKDADPVGALRRKVRGDAGKARAMSEEVKRWLSTNHKQRSRWSYRLHFDNLKVCMAQNPQMGAAPSYPTVVRYMKTTGLIKRKGGHKPLTAGQITAEERLRSHEVRSFEVEHVGGLWHLDFHKASRQILTSKAELVTPLALCIIDDHSRLCCHIQWYFNETTDVLVHGFIQALQKRGLPRSLLTDNGSAMTSDEFTEGLSRLGIHHNTTLPYSPHQNGKQESFWGSLEGRLVAMLSHDKTLGLKKLNDVTQAWVEIEYNRKIHSETSTTPLDRFLHAKDVSRTAPDLNALTAAFRKDVKRTQRRSDGTFSLEGRRFEVPKNFRHVKRLSLRYARWDLSLLHLIDDKTGTILAQVFPVDLAKNAEGGRRVLETQTELDEDLLGPDRDPPLLEKLIADYSASGLPPAYLPTTEDAR